MFNIKVLVRKCAAVDGNTACAVAVEKVAALDHETVDRAVEDGVFVAHGLAVGGFVFSRAELAEVFGGFGDSIGVKLEFHAALGDATDGYIEEDHWIGASQVLHAVYHRFVRHLASMRLRELS